MEQLIGKLLPKPEDFVKMPYGTLAYAAFGLMFFNFALGVFEPRAPICLGFAMIGFLFTAAGRDHVAHKVIGEINSSEDMADHEKLTAAANYVATTKHMRSLAMGCLALVLIWAAKSIADGQV